MKPISVLFFLLVTSAGIQAQDALASRIKIDGVSAVIGDYVILDSDVDKTILEMESQGIDVRGISKCQLLGKLMEDKLYAHHAIQDSLEVNVEEVYSTVDQIIDNFTQQLGSIEKVLEFYNKEDEATFRQDIFEINNKTITFIEWPQLIADTKKIKYIKLTFSYSNNLANRSIEIKL